MSFWRGFLVCEAFLCIAARYVHISTHTHSYVYTYIHTLHTYARMHGCMYIYTPWSTSWPLCRAYIYMSLFLASKLQHPLASKLHDRKMCARRLACFEVRWNVLQCVAHASRLVWVAVCCIVETDMCCSVLQRAKCHRVPVAAVCRHWYLWTFETHKCWKVLFIYVCTCLYLAMSMPPITLTQFGNPPPHTPFFWKTKIECLAATAKVPC